MTPDDKFETQEQMPEPVIENQPVVVTEELPGTELPPPAAATAAAAGVVVKTDRKIYGGMFGVPEIVGMAASCLVLLGVIGFYFLVVAPAKNDLKNKKVQRDELDKKLTDTRAKFDKYGTTAGLVTGLNASVEDFESRNLQISGNGRTALYDRINGLMVAYNLRNTAGPEYSPLEIKEFKSNEPQREERGRSKFESLFPGVYINMTLEGTYVNLRRFMSEIESSNQFVVISLVELEAADNKQQAANNPQTGQPPNPGNPDGVMMGPNGPIGGRQPGAPAAQPAQAAPRGKNHGDLVNLHLELAAYFHRENVSAPGAVPENTSVNK
jgi:hypothetical protein